jgi:gamma-glutamyltranspeptidase / glutathione hydrolase
MQCVRDRVGMIGSVMFAALVLGAGCAAPERDPGVVADARAIAGSGVDDAPSHALYEREAVACDHLAASEAGARMLAMGGNAVDAAVAASFTLSVVRPYSCGIGGGGFMVIHLVDDPRTPAPDDAVSVSINYRERSPGAVGPEHFVDLPEGASTSTGHAVAVPGTVAGLLLALEEFGTLDRRTVLAPAIEAAERGYAVGSSGRDAARRLHEALGAEGATLGSASPRQHAWLLERFAPGAEAVRNPEQARALRLIAERGAPAFYEGPIARAVMEAVQEAGGVMTLEDLAGYEPTVGPALTAEVELGEETLTLVTMPPPSSGGVAMIQTLGVLKHYEAQMQGHVQRGPMSAASPDNPEYGHALIESWRHAFADRARWLADPAFVAVPLGAMLDDGRLEAAAHRLHPEKTFPAERYGVYLPPASARAQQLPDDAGTSHLSVVDRFGNAVACTETINLEFGSKVVVTEFGFALNNEMDDFLTRPGEANTFGLVQSRRNLPEPGKRPLSSMTPTVVLGVDGGVRAVAGASGGPRIITATLQALVNALNFKMRADEAIAQPRVHQQWQPVTVYYEPAIDGGLLSGLEERGHELIEREAPIGVVQMIVREGKAWHAASDPRKGGAPAGR